MSGTTRSVTVEAIAGSYEVRVGTDLLAAAGELLAERAVPGPVLVVTDENVAPLYLPEVEASLRSAGFAPAVSVVPAGETAKSLDTLETLYRALLDLSADRSSAVVALGGGVVSDLAGFAAATWMRGVRWLVLPTTLLSQVDASVGGKTAVNLAEGKNLVGAFHAPVGVAADLGTLETQTPRDFRSGLAEVVKMALAFDPELYERIEADPASVGSPEGAGLEDAVLACVEAKGRVVGADEHESGLRRVLNLGHTAGHAIEAAAGYGGVLHGEAVAVGLVAAVRISIRRCGLEPGWEGRLRRLLGALGLPVALGELGVAVSPAEVLRQLTRDKKSRGRRLALVLLAEPGRPRIVEDGTPEEVLEALTGA